MADEIGESVAVEIAAKATRHEARPFNFAALVPFHANSAADDIAAWGGVWDEVRGWDEEFSGPGGRRASGFELDAGGVDRDSITARLDACAVVEEDLVDFARCGACWVEDEFEGVARDVFDDGGVRIEGSEARG